MTKNPAKQLLTILAILLIPIQFMLTILMMPVAMFISEAPLDYVLDFWKERL